MTDPLILVEQHLACGIPVPIFEILGHIGLGPEYRMLDDNISGWIERRNGGSGYWVVINADHPRVRQRFTAAHELGHYIYHRDLLASGVGDTRAYRSVGTPLPNAAITQQHERQANSFAANTLMPQNEVLRLRRTGVTDPRELARRFDVSEDAMRIRLGLPRQSAAQTFNF
ncbi:ImmA/IrrE family metallo-endopeptidase [Methylocystis sp. S23]